MKVEIKNIKILSVLFSALPLAVFIVMFFTSLISYVIETETFTLTLTAQAFFAGLAETFYIYIFLVIGIALYNLLSSLGIKGVRVELNEVEK